MLRLHKSRFNSLVQQYRSYLMLFLLTSFYLTNNSYAQAVLKGTVPVNPPVAGFGIDGDLLANVPFTGNPPAASGIGDWLRNTAASGGVLKANGDSIAANRSFHTVDAYSSSDNSLGGGLKKNGILNDYTWVTGSPSPSKCNINHLLVHIGEAVSSTSVGQAGDTWITLAGDRESTNGNSFISIALHQRMLTANANGTFTSGAPRTTGGRTVGDVQISAEFTGGGNNPNLYLEEWRLVNGEYVWFSIPVPAGAAFGSVNSAAITGVPYSVFGGSSYPINAFIEVSFNISAIYRSTSTPCVGSIASMFVVTKTSQSVQAALSDFVEPLQINLNLNVLPPTVTGATTYCAGAYPTQLTANNVTTGAVVNWYSNSDTSAANRVMTNSLTYTPPGPITSNRTYYVTQSLRGCQSAATPVPITVNPLPTATIGPSAGSVCQNGTDPNVTFTGANGTAPYTFTYKINGGSDLTVTTTSGNSVNVAAPTGTVGSFIYSLVSVRDASTTTCSQLQTGSATVTVNPLPTATIGASPGSVCQNGTAPNVTFTGAGGTAPYTFTYKINGGTDLTVTTTSGNSVNVAALTGTVGSFLYSLVSVRDASSTTCSQLQTGSATVTVNPLPTATIGASPGSVCQNGTAPNVTFTGANGTAPYTFTYKINGGTDLTVTTTSGNSVNVSAPTGTVGSFIYSLVSVRDASSTTCAQTQTGSTTVTVLPLPTASIGGSATVCQNGRAPTITFSGAIGTLPYTFTYKIGNGSNQTISTTGTNTSVTLAAPTGTVGTFVYTLVSVQDASSTTCSQLQAGSATVIVNPLPTASISGTASVCQFGTSPNITFTGAIGTAPYTFTYNINGAANQTISTTGTNTSVTLAAPTGTAGTFVYNLVSVRDASSTICSQAQTGTATITVNAQVAGPLATILPISCSSLSFSVQVTNPVGGTRYTITQPGNTRTFLPIDYVVTNPLTPAIFSGLTFGDGYNIVATVGNCSSAPNICAGAARIATATVVSDTSEVPTVKSAATETKLSPVQAIKLTGASTEVLAVPNPFNDRVRFTLQSAVSGQGTLDLFNTMGQRVQRVFSGYIEKGQIKSIEYIVAGYKSGNLIYVFTVGDQKTTGTLINLK